MRQHVNVYSSQAQAHYDDLLSAIGSRPVTAEQWYSRRDERRLARRSRRGRRAAQALVDTA